MPAQKELVDRYESHLKTLLSERKELKHLLAAASHENYEVVILDDMFVEYPYHVSTKKAA
ncbi:hypothetical protein [Bacillus licheniformis]|uniref:hypothetical protein n=1 Tax=Bacillus licheniformis TaxID=1402 RepID=UPI001E644E2C|nr:hypothetical protein [Bacillus licheniformis]